MEGADIGESVPGSEAEPQGPVVQYEDVEFEPFEEIESETPGETHTLRVPILDAWEGQRLEFRIHYESRSGAGEPAELLSVDVTGTLPGVEGVEPRVEDGVVTIVWDDVRDAEAVAAAAILSQPMFEVFRQQGGARERIGRALGPEYADRDVQWGEEACYAVQLVVAAETEERVIEDPGPEFDPPPEVTDPDSEEGGEGEATGNRPEDSVDLVPESPGAATGTPPEPETVASSASESAPAPEPVGSSAPPPASEGAPAPEPVGSSAPPPASEGAPAPEPVGSSAPPPASEGAPAPEPVGSSAPPPASEGAPAPEPVGSSAPPPASEGAPAPEPVGSSAPPPASEGAPAPEPVASSAAPSASESVPAPEPVASSAPPLASEGAPASEPVASSAPPLASEGVPAPEPVASSAPPLASEGAPAPEPAASSAAPSASESAPAPEPAGSSAPPPASESAPAPEPVGSSAPPPASEGAPAPEPVAPVEPPAPESVAPTGMGTGAPPDMLPPAPGAPTGPGRGASAPPTPALADPTGTGTAALPDTMRGTPPDREADPLAPAAWSPIPVRVPPAGAGALSVGPLSELVCVTPIDTFPPAPPEDLRAFQGEAAIELSWLPVPADDLAGYHVYRAGQSGPFRRLTGTPVERADFRDVDREPELVYRYQVTAVDTAQPGNESAPSDSVVVRPR